MEKEGWRKRAENDHHAFDVFVEILLQVQHVQQAFRRSDHQGVHLATAHAVGLVRLRGGAVVRCYCSCVCCDVCDVCDVCMCVCVM